MTTILVVCGAGASSTFLAHRMRVLASEGNHTLTITAASEPELSHLADRIDVVLVGSHLADRFEFLSAIVLDQGGTAVLLAPFPSPAAGASAALDAAIAAISTRDDARADGPAPTEAFPTNPTT